MNWGAVAYVLLGFVCGLWITWTVTATDNEIDPKLVKASDKIEREFWP